MSACIPLLIELADDVVLSETAATVGAHRSLDHIPGAALLGVAAARGYGEVKTGFRRFHSGSVRFLNGYPAVEEDGQLKRALPMPLAAHRYKEKSAPDSLRDFLNLSIAAPGANQQVVQSRHGYVLPGLPPPIEPTRRYGMKSAMSEATGRSQEAQLFGYEAVGAGQRFIAGVEADDPEEAETVARLLLGTVQLGRSRSAEFGQTTVSRLGGAMGLPEQGPAPDGFLRLWALSDLCLHDAMGNPVLDPAQADLGLGAFTVEWSKTFVRTRTIWPFNNHWRSRGLARPVISKGSVITVRLHEDARRPKSSAGTVGLFRETGLGQVAFDPLLLKGETLCPFTLPGYEMSAATHAPAMPRSEFWDREYALALEKWCVRQRTLHMQQSEMDKRVDTALAELAAHYAAAQCYQGRRGIELLAPTSAQWHAVAAAARSARTSDALHVALLGEHSPIASVDDVKWRGGFGKAETECFRAWLEAAAKAAGTDAPREIALIARAAADYAEAWATLPRGVRRT